MAISLYDAAVPVYRQMLGALDAMHARAAANAAARGFDASVLLQSRLAPDMYPLARQVQIACDNAKGAVARIAGVEPPRHADTEQTIDELRTRIATVLGYVDGFGRERLDGQEAREVTLALRDRTLKFNARDYLLHWALPNFYFHVTTAYALLRHNGVDLGKRDFLGKLPL
ncbi:MAG: DUF1993 domain-containing protein [Burkholderiaceae bacterium]